MVGFRAGPEKVQDETGTSCARKKENAPKNNGASYKDTEAGWIGFQWPNLRQFGQQDH